VAFAAGEVYVSGLPREGAGDAKQEDTMSEPTQLRRFRASLIDNADSSAGWRYRKAREFPWDARNVESGKSLRRLRRALTELPPDDALWSRYAAVWSEAAAEDRLRFVEIEHEMLHSYGFSYRGAAGNAERFLFDLVRALELELRAFTPAPRMH
jgi:hypothetical protein